MPDEKKVKNEPLNLRMHPEIVQFLRHQAVDERRDIARIVEDLVRDRYRNRVGQFALADAS